MAPPPHALIIPYPAQGHVIPLLELAHALVDRGFTVTFANSEFNHRRVVAAAAESSLLDRSRIRLVAVPDGMEPGEDRNNLVRLTLLMAEHMAPRVEDLIRRSGGDGDQADADQQSHEQQQDAINLPEPGTERGPIATPEPLAAASCQGAPAEFGLVELGCHRRHYRAPAEKPNPLILRSG